MHSGFRTSITAFNYLHIYIYNLKIQEVLILKCINFLLWNMSQQNCESYRTVTLVQARLQAEVFVKCSIACVPSREMRPLALSSCYIGFSNHNHWGANDWTVMTTPKWLCLFPVGFCFAFTVVRMTRMQIKKILPHRELLLLSIMSDYFIL